MRAALVLVTVALAATACSSSSGSRQGVARLVNENGGVRVVTKAGTFFCTGGTSRRGFENALVKQALEGRSNVPAAGSANGYACTRV